MRKTMLILILACTPLLAAGQCGTFGYANFDFQPFAFPIENPDDIVRIAAFGIPNWSDTEPHNGTDLIIDETLTSTRIISPTAGVVSGITSRENPFSEPPGQLLLTVSIRVNGEWTVHLVLEPSTIDADVRAAQSQAVFVTQGEAVDVGTPIADLLVGTLGYPHLHYMIERNDAAVCAYEHSSAAARQTFEDLSELPGSNLPDGNICYGQPGGA